MSTGPLALAPGPRSFMLRGMRFAVRLVNRLAPHRLAWQAFCLLVSIGAAMGCEPEIGDDCEGSVDCSVSGDRLCDRSVPNSGGYCTISGCEEGTCPDDSICVKFRPEPERLSTTWCMRPCGGNGDCRTADGFFCVTAAELGDENFAQTLDGADKRFCAALPTSEP